MLVVHRSLSVVCEQGLGQVDANERAGKSSWTQLCLKYCNYPNFSISAMKALYASASPAPAVCFAGICAGLWEVAVTRGRVATLGALPAIADVGPRFRRTAVGANAGRGPENCFLAGAATTGAAGLCRAASGSSPSTHVLPSTAVALAAAVGALPEAGACGFPRS